MIAFALHELRMVGRRAAWPAAIVLHAAGASLFVAVWAPTSGIPLWQASVLQQLAAADRLLIAVTLTWLSTMILADDDRGRLVEWSALTGLPHSRVFVARAIAAVIAMMVLVSAAVPAFASAAESSAATTGHWLAQFATVAGFAVFAVGMTCVTAATLRSRVAAWLAAMAVALIAAFAMQLLDGIALRALVPAISGAALVIVSPAAVENRRLDDTD